MRASGLAVIVLVAAAAAGVAVDTPAHGQTQAQALPFALFGRYLLALQEQAHIPGLSAAIVQDGRIGWEQASGFQDLERSIPATALTPYPINDLTETFAATLLLQCVERGRLDLDAEIRGWTTAIPEPHATVRQVLSHTSHAGQPGFKFDPARYAALTPVIDACSNDAYRAALTKEILDRFGMADSVPGADLAEPSAALREMYDASTLERYAAVLRRMATPYRIDGKGKPSRAELPARIIDASTGLVSTVRDLARYDAAIDDLILLERESLEMAWTPVVSAAGVPQPTGLGWFVRVHNGELVVWHFGSARDAYSSLIIKVPARRLTLILLANSDGLASPSSLAEGDLTSSVFAKLFLHLFV